MSINPKGLSAETTWFHLFRDMIDSGDMARLDGSTIKIYLVVKSYTNFGTGRAFPSIETIATKAGLSERQVMRGIAELESSGYVTKQKTGRHNVYMLREKIMINDDSGKPQAIATWDYLPNGVRDSVADLKNVLVTGDFAGAKIINIQNLTVNVIPGDHNMLINNLNTAHADLSKLPKAMREAILAMRPKLNP